MLKMKPMDKKSKIEDQINDQILSKAWNGEEVFNEKLIKAIKDFVEQDRQAWKERVLKEIDELPYMARLSITGRFQMIDRKAVKQIIERSLKEDE